MAREIDRWRTWKKDHPGYPLTAHPSGQWSKKIRGHVYYFGRLDDPDAALALWNQEGEYLLAGLTPPEYTNGMIVEELIGKHCIDVSDRVVTNHLSNATQRLYKVAYQLLKEAGIYKIAIQSIGPQHFTIIQGILERSGRALRTQKNLIVAVKAIFNWGRQMGFYEHEIRYGPRFVLPSLNAIEAEQEEKGVCRFLERDLILEALGVASPVQKIAILLGINCGFYPGDTCAIPIDRIHLNVIIPYHYFRRAKNRQRRMAALWPETVETIREYLDKYRSPIESSERHLILTQAGRPYGEYGADALSRSFNTLIKDKRRKGASLGSLRHTYGTVVDLVPDQAMIDLTMGHTSKTLQKRVYRQFNLNELERLSALAQIVREWLFGSGENIP